jgi:hypothetical protein
MGTVCEHELQLGDRRVWARAPRARRLTDAAGPVDDRAPKAGEAGTRGKIIQNQREIIKNRPKILDVPIFSPFALAYLRVQHPPAAPPRRAPSLSAALGLWCAMFHVFAKTTPRNIRARALGKEISLGVAARGGGRPTRTRGASPPGQARAKITPHSTGLNPWLRSTCPCNRRSRGQFGIKLAHSGGGELKRP